MVLKDGKDGEDKKKARREAKKHIENELQD